MPLRRSLVALLLAFAAACSDSPTGSSAGPADSLKVLPRALSQGELEAIASSNRFAFDLFKSINTRFVDTNVFISPLSASFALGMTLNGANGETFEGMRTALRIEDPELSSINAGYSDLIALLLALDPSVDMRIANAIWYRETFPFHQAFLDTVAPYFSARVTGLDFGAPATVDRINAWVDTATAGKIPKVLDAIGPDLVMLLMNAIYFKGSWRSQFDPAQTQDAAFATENGSAFQARMMHLNTTVALSSVGGARAVDLPYGRADVYLPRFQMKWEDKLNSDLKAMGMDRAFCDCADFSRMSPEGVFISFVKQNTFVNVNEEGTEAAAVTTVGIETTSGRPSIRFDRPFVFVIRERLSGTILFMGKVAVPTLSG
ncbi:MAG: serpin family protein [Gemmatimonadaceae bacterium]